MATLDEIRNSINEIDTQLLALLPNVVQSVLKLLKINYSVNVLFETNGEQELLAYLTQVGNPMGLSEYFILCVYSN